MVQRSNRHFDAHYREPVELADGTEVELRLLTAADASLLREGFEELSPHSRVMRFLHDKQSLSDEELHYLTDVDGEHHFAIGAVARRPDGTEKGIGIARFMRMPEQPETAEAAVTVIDAYQGRGLGKVLLSRLAEAARERGVARFACWVRAGNLPMQRLIDELGPWESSAEGDAVLYTVPLPETTSLPSEPLRRMLALAAEGALVVLGRVLRSGEHGRPMQTNTTDDDC